MDYPGYNKPTELQLQLSDELHQSAKAHMKTLKDLKEGGEVDPRWISIAITEAQQSTMAAKRAIMKPDDDA